MNNAGLNQHIIRHLMSAEKHLRAYKKARNPKSLHRMRVDIKKIRALSSFGKAIYRKKFALSKLKHVFSGAGKIRETQLHLKLITALPKAPEDLVSKLKQQEGEFKQHFLQNATVYTRNIRSFKKHLPFVPAAPPQKKVTRYFKYSIKAANKKLKEGARKDMHAFRKQIKELMYIYNALPKKLQKRIDIDPGKLDKIQQKLGKWHDTYSLVDFLVEQNKSEQLKKHIGLLKKKEMREFAGLLKTKLRI